jgi:hypothetical protein
MSDWTLGAVKARNMEIVALCEAESCRHMFVFDLDALIAGVGSDYALDDIPAMDCPRCGVRPLLIRLSFADPTAGGGGGIVSFLFVMAGLVPAIQ